TTRAARVVPAAGKAGLRRSRQGSAPRRATETHAPLPSPRPAGPPSMSNVIETLERRQLRDGVPQFKAGDTVRVHFRVIEGQRSRVQVFEGIVIKRQGSGARETFTVRKQSFGVGVERTFPLHSPKIDKIEVVAIRSEDTRLNSSHQIIS